MIKEIFNNLLDFSEKEERAISFFLFGLAIYSITVAFVTESRLVIIVFQLLQLASLALMLFGAITLIKFKFDNFYLSIVYTVYLLWLFVIFIGVFKYLDYSYFKSSFLGAPYGPMLYFSPLILLFPRKFLFYRKLFTFIIIFGIFYLLFNAFFIKDLLNSNTSSKRSQTIVETLSSLSLPCGFIILTSVYHTKKRFLTALGIVIIALAFAIIRARRGLILMYSEFLFFGYLFYFFKSKSRIIILYFTLLLTLLGFLYAFQLYKPTDNKIFGFLLEKGDEDTRTGIELYFYDDMKSKDWIVGRGIEGQYFCPDIEEDQVTNYRKNIETGYLQTILKGGLISLGLFLLIALPAVIKGVFFSKNIFSKAAGIWVLLSIINSYPTIVNGFTLEYLLVWFSIGICYSSKIRQMSELDILMAIYPEIENE